MTKFWRTQIYFFQTAGVKGIFRTLCWSRQTPGFHKTILEFVKRHMFILRSIYDKHRICHFYFTKLHVSYYHFPNSVTLRFIKQARNFTQRFPHRYRLDLQNQYNLHTEPKANQYTDQSYSVSVRWIVLKHFTNTWTVT